MAGKNNAKPAKQTKPAKDAAVVETADGAVEQTLTPPVPPVPEDEAGAYASLGAAMTKAERDAALFGLPKEFFERAHNHAAAQESEVKKGAAPAENQTPEMALYVNGKTITAGDSNPYELEPVCTIGPDDMESFADAVFEAVASLIAGAGFLVRQGDEQVSPFGKNLLAVSFRQGKGFTAVTSDGHKFVLSNGEVNGA